jgi:exopolysaccharide biosynthesis polyprenyl glycosylphosphotransferase
MYRGKKQKFDWGFTVICGDLAAVALSFPLSFAITRAIWSEGSAGIPDSLLPCLIYGLIILIVAREANLHWWRCFVRTSPLLMRLPVVLLVSAAVFCLLRFALGSVSPLEMMPWLFVHYATALVLFVAVRRFVFILDNHILKRIEMERIAFVGWSPKLETVVQSMKAEMGEFQEVVGMIHETDLPDEKLAEHGYRLLGPLSKLENIIEQHPITLLLVDENTVTPSDLRTIADVAARELVSLKMIPGALDIWASKLSVRVRAGIPVIGINDLHHDLLINRLLKRTVDIIGAVVGLTFGGPIIAIMAVLIYLESPGPVFYRQQRRGQGQKLFDMIKLRSMRPDAEASGVLITVENDPRRLKIGKFMRSWNLDELPQFWNVLVGDMSLVGPRPERIESVNNYQDTIRYYNLRHTCKPGLTGWAAVHGLRGNTSIDERIEYDLFYVENWSLLLDFKIMFMTLAPPKNAY